MGPHHPAELVRTPSPPRRTTTVASSGGFRHARRLAAVADAVAERTASGAAERLASDAAAGEARPLRTEKNNVLSGSLAVEAVQQRTWSVAAATAAEAAAAAAAAEAAPAAAVAEAAAADAAAADEVAAYPAAMTRAFAVGPPEPSKGAPSAVAVGVRLPAGQGGGVCGRRFAGDERLARVLLLLTAETGVDGRAIVIVADRLRRVWEVESGDGVPIAQTVGGEVVRVEVRCVAGWGGGRDHASVKRASACGRQLRRAHWLAGCSGGGHGASP